MKKVTKLICAITIICLLTSCTAKPNNSTETDGTTTTTTQAEKKLPETSVLPEPMAQNSNEKKSHSYGVAKDGKANEISINNQKYFESNKESNFANDFIKANNSSLRPKHLWFRSFFIPNLFYMVDFLCMCLRYGVSTVVAGATSSGKTTLLNALLTTIPDGKRVFTIETGSRELSLVRKKNGKVVNNVVHTLSRPSDNPAFDITQEDLVVASLRFNPDIVCVGEMRDVECYSAVEASLTGHTVVSTVHAFAADSAHMRIALLCQKRFPIDFKTSLMQAGQAFPIVVYTHKLENNERKIMDISECEILSNGERVYHTLFRFHITKNKVVNGKFVTEGYFEQPEIMSDSLKKKAYYSKT